MAAQNPMMLGAIVVPLRWGAASFAAANALQTIGAAVTALGILLGIAGLVTLGSALTPFPRSLEHSHLRQSGVYAIASRCDRSAPPG